MNPTKALLFDAYVCLFSSTLKGGTPRPHAELDSTDRYCCMC